MDVTIGVATFGHEGWQRLAARRAIPSAQRLDVPVIAYHGTSLQESRQHILDQVTTEWIIYLDGDDELEPGYVAAMASGSADLRAPSVRYVDELRRPTRAMMPRVWGHTHACTAACLPYGNWLVIGACARVQALRRAGGWRDYAWSEDWDLWVRTWQAGATVEAIPWATYRAHTTRRGRNHAGTQEARLAVHRAIATANGLPVP